MNTIVIDIDNLVQGFTDTIHRLRGQWERAVLTSSGVVLAEINLFPEPVDLSEFKFPGATPPHRAPEEPRSARIAYSKLTGLPVVLGRPGQSMVTSEEIYELLRSSFP
jgi:hypothetical protein